MILLSDFSGWRLWSEFEYMFSTDNDVEAMNFTSAEKTCGQYNAHLVTVLSTSEDVFLG